GTGLAGDIQAASVGVCPLPVQRLGAPAHGRCGPTVPEDAAKSVTGGGRGTGLAVQDRLPGLGGGPLAQRRPYSTALAARIGAVPIGSSWTNVLDRASLGCTVVDCKPNCNPGRDLSYALRAGSRALLAGSNPALASGSQVPAGGDRWLLTAVRGHLGDTWRTPVMRRPCARRRRRTILRFQARHSQFGT